MGLDPPFGLAADLQGVNATGLGSWGGDGFSMEL